MTTKIDPVLEFEEATERFHALQGEAVSLERKAGEIEAGIRAQEQGDRTTEAARALLDGATIEEVQDQRDRLLDVRTQLRVTRRAIELQRERVDALKRDRDAVILDAAEGEIHAAAQELAEKLVAASEAADALDAHLSEIRSQGVSYLGRFPGLRLSPLLASNPEGRLNSFVSELERDYGATVKRKALEAKQKADKAAHAAEVERARLAGGGISAGPDGVVEFLPGGKVRKPRRGGRNAGADDFKTAAAWGLT